MPAPTEITVSQLARLIGTPSAPLIVDTRLDEDFDAYPSLIPGAFRYPFAQVHELVPRCRGKRVVVVCHQGKKLSQGAAAVLRTHAVEAEVLTGGAVAWRESGHLALAAHRIPRRNASGQTVWVTRHRPKIDRMACPWLIRRFVDPLAQFLFVSPGEVLGVAERFGAEPFDVEEVFWSHRGEGCTFDAMIEEFALRTEPLERVATIVRGADTNRLDLAPQSAGLMAVSLGLSRMFRDDLEQIEAGMMVYDALYRWARDAMNETHDWPPHTTSA